MYTYTLKHLKSWSVIKAISYQSDRLSFSDRLRLYFYVHTCTWHTVHSTHPRRHGINSHCSDSPPTFHHISTLPSDSPLLPVFRPRRWYNQVTWTDISAYAGHIIYRTYTVHRDTHTHTHTRTQAVTCQWLNVYESKGNGVHLMEAAIPLSKP